MDSSSLSTLLDIRQKCEEIRLEEDRGNQRLEDLLHHGSKIGVQLDNLRKFLTTLDHVKLDADQLCGMTTLTSSLAESVSAKVRRLDVMKSHISGCQSRVDDLLDLQNCTEGVRTSLQNEDFEEAAGHIHRFLSLDEAALTSKEDDSGLRDAFASLHASRAHLMQVVSAQFDLAVSQDDAASVERFFKIFPLLNMQEEGLQKFSKCLQRKLREAWTKAQLAGKQEHKRENVKFADLLTILLEETARIIEVHQPLVETYYGPGNLTYVVAELQKECDSHFREVIESFRRGRNFENMISNAKMWLGTESKSKRRGGSISKLDAKAVDALLGELVLIGARIALYTKFITKRCTTDAETIEGLEEKSTMLGKVEKVVKGSQAVRCLEELLGDYASIENEQRGCILRRDEYWLQNFPTGYLDLSQAYNVLQSSIQHGKLHATTDTETARLAFLLHLNHSEMSVDYAKTMRKKLMQEVDHPEQGWDLSTKDRVKLDNSIGQIQALEDQFRQVNRL
ncbi:unnamed protein product [Notodromas monacha]|uniref:Conserved oligomeric Golgi complex subunit 4 n=1 Tax=Notodromas monacha TaxID=399045 RepID=A0A7R9BDK2_9CRUS|nr:unnamed protein product [Notodromas monacha]CAG0913419.1 unnamed protein product [Notodromas monacha]